MAAQPGPFLHPFAKPAATDFLCVVRGEGALVWDDAGREYIDAMAGLWYCNVGHGRAEIAEAVASQMRQLAGFHAFERYTNPVAEALTARVAGLAPTPGSRVFLTSSGSEAVDSALKLARFAHALAGRPERTLVLSRIPSYHGVTYGGTAATGLAANREGWGPLPEGFLRVPHDDLAAAQAVFAEHGDRIACVLAEPVIGAPGVIPPVEGYLQGLRELCDAHGAWLVLDEVITGFGRLGHWWGADRYGVRPDLQTFAKGITGGYIPLGGVLVAPPVLVAMATDPAAVLRTGHTYSGHPAACAAGMAVLDLLVAEDLLARAPRIGERLSSGLRGLVDEGLLAGIRGDGAMWGALLGEDSDASTVRDGLLEEGVMVRPIGADVLAFSPPLVITAAQVDRCIEALGAVLRRAPVPPVPAPRAVPA